MDMPSYGTVDTFVQNVSFYAGEEKYVTATISPIDPDEIVVIKEAGFELTDCKGNMVSAGVCEIRGQEISVPLPIERPGSYILKLTVRVGRETIIEKVAIFAGA